MEFNGLIFRELIKRGYSLEGKTRVWNIADSKLWYLTPEQAQAFLDLEENSPDYKRDLVQKEIDLIKENIDNIVKKIGIKKPINVIDLGCGDGKKAVIFISFLKDKLKVRYCPIDISNYMIERAIENIKNLNHVEEIVEFQWNVSDFENLENVADLLRKGKFKNNFILLLGNTFGNFELNELLYEVRSSMKDGDFLLIGNGLETKQPTEILKAYDNDLLDNLLIKTLTQIGFKREDLEYGARFRNSRVEMYYTVKRDLKISFLGKNVSFNVGDQIVVALSYKYEAGDFRSFMQMYFDDVDFYVSKDEAYALVLCKK
jgi:uncharacterized SAM-dependent methyltransferase